MESGTCCRSSPIRPPRSTKRHQALLANLASAPESAMHRVERVVVGISAGLNQRLGILGDALRLEVLCLQAAIAEADRNTPGLPKTTSARSVDPTILQTNATHIVGLEALRGTLDAWLADADIGPTAVELYHWRRCYCHLEGCDNTQSSQGRRRLATLFRPTLQSYEVNSDRIYVYVEMKPKQLNTEKETLKVRLVFKVASSPAPLLSPCKISTATCCYATARSLALGATSASLHLTQQRL